MTTVVLDAPRLGDRSYLISDGEVGVVVDPQRDLFPYLQETEKLGVSITVVLKTHIHNDYVSGGLAFAQATGATYAIPTGEQVSFSDECRALDDGDTLVVGQLEVTVIATAGHTAHDLSYLFKLAGGGDDVEAAEHVVCTGGSLLVNATGQTDLLGPDLAETLARGPAVLDDTPEGRPDPSDTGRQLLLRDTNAKGRVCGQPVPDIPARPDIPWGKQVNAAPFDLASPSPAAQA